MISHNKQQKKGGADTVFAGDKITIAVLLLKIRLRLWTNVDGDKVTIVTLLLMVTRKQFMLLVMMITWASVCENQLLKVGSAQETAPLKMMKSEWKNLSLLPRLTKLHLETKNGK